MVGIFRKRRSAPALVPTDHVVPLHFWDETALLKAFILYNMFVFEDALDAAKLCDSFERLAQRPGWARLGARLRKNNRGSLEWHIPVEYTAKRPAVAYTHAEHNMGIEEHPLASQLPRPSTRPALVGDPEKFQKLYQGPGFATKLDDYLFTDRPAVGLHVISFSNATIVVMYWSHMAFDAMAGKSILNAWTLMLQGREDEIPEPYGMESDPLSEIGKDSQEPHALVHRRMSMFKIAIYALRNIIDLGFRSKENRIVCVPASFLTKLHAQTLEELILDTKHVDSEYKPFLTEGDVIAAWWTRLAISHLPRRKQRTVVIQNLYSQRKVLERDCVLPADRPYISNCIGMINCVLSTSDILEKPLSYTASRIREAINEQGSSEQVQAYCALIRKTSPKSKMPPFFGETGMYSVAYSNWAKAELFDVDFGSARVDKEGDGLERPCRPSYLQHTSEGSKFPEGFAVLGKDEHGNIWLSGYRVKGLWAKLEKELKSAVAW